MASPKKLKASRGWEKERNVALYFMGTWDWAEIFVPLLVLILPLYSETELLTSLTVNSLELEESLTQNQITKPLTTFVCSGPVARTCSKLIKVASDQSYNASLEIYLSQVDSKMDAFTAHGGQ